MPESTITIIRTVPAAPEAAWRSWTDAGELARWWWPMFPDTTYDWNPAEGAAYRIESAQAGFGVRGVFIRVDQPRRFACTWVWLDDALEQAAEDTVEVTFDPEGEDKTVVTVRHTSDSHAADGGALTGWNDVLDRLVAQS